MVQQQYNLCTVSEYMKKKRKEKQNECCINVFWAFGGVYKHGFDGESEVKMSRVLMIILCIVMTNRGASDTDACYKIVPVVFTI